MSHQSGAHTPLKDIAKRVLTRKEYDAWILTERITAHGRPPPGHRTIALALGISPSTARDRLARARRKLLIALSSDV